MTSDDFYVHTDIPPGVTIDEYRRSRPRERKARRRVIAVGLAIGSRRPSKSKKGAGQPA